MKPNTFGHSHLGFPLAHSTRVVLDYYNKDTMQLMDICFNIIQTDHPQNKLLVCIHFLSFQWSISVCYGCL